MTGTALYRTIWRWHFYAGLFVIPLILILATTGAIYLFKPQVERWEERAWQGLPSGGRCVARQPAATPRWRLFRARGFTAIACPSKRAMRR